MQQELSKKLLFLALIVVGAGYVGTVFAQPVCPVCVVAIGAGLGFSRWLGVDDLVSSVWIGAALLTIVYWSLHWMRKKNWDFKFSGPVVFLAYYIFTFIPLWFVQIIGHPLNKVFGIDKIILGSVSGNFVLWLGLKLHAYLKTKNNDKSYFPYQRVAVPMVCLVLNSLIFYLLLTWKII